MTILTKTTKLLAGTALGLASLLPFAASAKAETWQAVDGHVRIGFAVDHFGYTLTRGTFDEFDLDLSFDEANPENTRVTAVISTDSIDTDFAARDDHLRNADFFNTEAFPEMRFETVRVERLSESTARLVGNLTLLGVTNPVSLEVALQKQGPNPLNQAPTMGFVATGTLDRTDWGMDTFAPAVGAEVELLIEAEISKL